MEKLLVLGGSLSQIPLIKKAKEMGLRVAVVDIDENADAVPYADEYYKCSLLNADGVLWCVEKFEADGITCGACDVGVMSCARACESLHKPGLSVETAQKVKNKEIMIQTFIANGVACPKHCTVTQEEWERMKKQGELSEIPAEISEKLKAAGLSFPLVTKPVDSSGSRGVNIAESMEMLGKAMKRSFRWTNSGQIILEEYLDGPEVSVEVVVQNGVPHVIQVTDKLTTGVPHFIEIGHSQPSMLDVLDLERIRDLAARAAVAVGIADGSAHAEIKLTKDGPKMVEIAGRMGGDFITTQLVPLSTGVDMAEIEIRRALGKPLPVESFLRKNQGAAIRFIKGIQGIVAQVETETRLSTISGIIDSKCLCVVGEKQGCVSNNNDRFGYVIATGRDAGEAVARCEDAISCYHITMAP